VVNNDQLICAIWLISNLRAHLRKLSQRPVAYLARFGEALCDGICTGALSALPDRARGLVWSRLPIFSNDEPRTPSCSAKTGQFLVEGDSYQEVARKLALNYLATFHEECGLHTALNRIKNMLAIAEAAEFGGVVQIDALPWHSRDLPSRIKQKLPRLIAECESTRSYTGELKSYLADKQVITVDGIGSRAGITKHSFESSWFAFKADLIGLDVKHAKLHEITVKGEKVSFSFDGTVTPALPFSNSIDLKP
jgi:hypothetical protein